MGGHDADGLGRVDMIGQADVARPAVGDDPRPRRGGAGDEGPEACRGEIAERRKTDPARLARGRQLHRARDEHLADRTAPLAASGGSSLVLNGISVSSTSITS